MQLSEIACRIYTEWTTKKRFVARSSASKYLSSSLQFQWGDLYADPPLQVYQELHGMFRFDNYRVNDATLIRILNEL